MRAALPFHEGGEDALFLSLFLFLLLLLRGGGAEDDAPARFQKLFAGGLELDAFDFAQDGSRGELAVGIEHGDEAARYQVEDAAFQFRQVLRVLAGGDDGVVVGHLRVVEHFLRFQQGGACQGCRQRLVVAQPLQDARTLGIDVIAEEGGIDTRIGGDLLLIQRLNDFKRLVGRVGELLVALHLQGGQVKEAGRRFLPLLLGDGGYGERGVLDLLQQGKSAFVVGDGVDAAVLLLLLGLLAGGDGLFLLLGLQHQLFLALSDDGGEGGVAIEGLQFPILLGDEVLDFQLAVHNQRQRRCLHAADGEHLAVLPVLHGVEAGGVHAQQPVADGARQARLIQGLEVRRIPQLGESLADGLFGQR